MENELQTAGIKLPLRGRSLDEVLTVTEGYKFQKRAREVQRIGVGYKDKGSISQGSYEPNEITPFSVPSNYKMWSIFAKTFQSRNYFDDLKIKFK
jgi:hypothetical protein